MRNFLTNRTFVTKLTESLIRNIKTLVAVKSDAMEQMAGKNFIYEPNLAKDEQALIQAIKKHKPDTLVVGANRVGKDALNSWANLVSKESKLIIRRGTSTAAIDIDEAKRLGIEVENTPHVNSVEVARNIYEIIQNNKKKSNAVGLIGFGHIGREIARLALASQQKVIAYSPTLSREHQKGKTEFRGFNLSEITAVNSAKKVAEESDTLVITAPYERGCEDEIFDQEALRKLKPKSLLICASEPEIFSENALFEIVKAANEKDVKIVFDNAFYAMKELEKKISALGGKKDNFTFQSELMSSKECQRDMDIAVLALLVKNALCRKLPEIYQELKQSSFSINEEKREVKIVGAGISSMIAAFYFHENGFAVEVLEKDKKENAQGTTRRGPDVRHITFSETVTHASSKRIADWLFSNISKDGNFFEKLFTEQFWVIGSNEALVSLLQNTVAKINRSAIEGEFGWNYLRDTYPDIFGEKIFGSGKILRVFSSEEELQKALKFQSEIHEKGRVRIVKKQELQEKLPMINSAEFVGAVEVDGYGVRIKSLCDAVENHLQQSRISKISWQQEVTKNGNEFVVKNWRNEIRKLEDISLVISSGISPVIEEDETIQRVYGLFVSIPNCGIVDPFKIHEKDPLGVVNITPSKDGKLHVSAGFQYFGSREANESDLGNLFENLEKRVSEIFPKSYERGVSEGSIERKFCPRPMTSHGLPKITSFENVISIGGTNSGGAVQSTILGQLVLLKVQNEIGIFDQASSTKEAIESVLQTTHQCLNYISNVIPSNSPKQQRSESFRQNYQSAEAIYR